MNKFLGITLAASALITGCSGDNNHTKSGQKFRGETYAVNPSPENCGMYEGKIRAEVNRIIPRDVNSHGELNGIGFEAQKNSCTFSVTEVQNGVRSKVSRSFYFDENRNSSTEIPTSPPMLARDNTNTSTKKRIS